jgi:hypothetical protein
MAAPTDPTPTLAQGLPLLGTLLGALIAFLSARGGLKRADDLARRREKERDDRQHLGAILLERYDRQRTAARAYARMLESGPEAIIDGRLGPVRELVLAAFEDEELANESTAAAREMLMAGDNASILEPREPKSYLVAMGALVQQTREQVEVPPVEDWKPHYQRALASADKSIADLVRDLGLDDAADHAAAASGVLAGNVFRPRE